MSISISAVLIIVFLIMLGVLGHGQWHSGETAAFGFFVNIFTGAHVTG